MAVTVSNILVGEAQVLIGATLAAASDIGATQDLSLIHI